MMGRRFKLGNPVQPHPPCARGRPWLYGSERIHGRYPARVGQIQLSPQGRRYATEYRPARGYILRHRPGHANRRAVRSGAGESAENGISEIVEATFEPLQNLVPFFALLRSELVHRQRRHTATVPQSVEHDLKAVTPFLDRDVVEFTTRIPLALFYDRSLYKRMIRDHLPDVAAVPYASTGPPLTEAPLQQAIKWRADRLMKYFPRMRTRLARRNQFFDFRGGVLAQADYFRQCTLTLSSLSPPLLDGAPAQRMADLLSGKIKATEQASSMLPPAYFVKALKQALNQGR